MHSNHTTENTDAVPWDIVPVLVAGLQLSVEAVTVMPHHLQQLRDVLLYLLASGNR